MDLSILVKRTSVNFGLEGVAVEEVVIDGVDFAAARNTGCRGNYAFDARHFFQYAVADSSLTATGRTRYDKKKATFLLRH